MNCNCRFAYDEGTSINPEQDASRMNIDNELRDELKKHLDDKDVSSFENGEVCLLLEEPKNALLRFTQDGLMRSDVEKEFSIKEGFLKIEKREFTSTTTDDAVQRVKKQQKITVAPFEM
jgi:hypothetical protein